MTPERLVAVVASYVELKQLGAELVGACPFCAHGRLWVSPSKGSACCLDCDAQHDAAGFVMALEGISQDAAAHAVMTREWAPKAPIVPAVQRQPRGRSTPARRKLIKQRCGAHARTTGKPCEAHVYRRPDGSLAKRCKNHGGASTGAKTPEGKARSLLALRTWTRASKRANHNNNQQSPTNKKKEVTP